MIGTKTTSSMLAAIDRGVRKQDSHLVVDDETSKHWDEIAADHAQLKKDHPRSRVEIPNDPDL